MNLLDDIIIYITSFLNTNDSINFLSISRDLHLLKDKIYYNKPVYSHIIHKLWYYDRFTNIMVIDTGIKLPKFINTLEFDMCFDNQDIKDCIPNSVTHLTFGHYFNQDIKDCIPNSVTHLTFGKHFNRPIIDCIPNSVTHLIFGDNFNQNIRGYIPNSVTYLKFGWCFNQDIDEYGSIPDSVTHLIFDSFCTHNYKNKILELVKYLKSIESLQLHFSYHSFSEEITSHLPEFKCVVRDQLFISFERITNFNF